MSVIGSIANKWSVFGIPSRRRQPPRNIGPGSSIRQDKMVHRYYNDRSILTSVYNRLAVDFADVVLRHVEVNEDEQYLDDVDSGLNDCLTLEANKDQAPRHFRQDCALSLFDKGVIAIVPVQTGQNPKTNENFDIFSIRVGEIVQWYPNHVRVNVYNEKRGIREDVTMEKRYVAIVENPFYAVMNEPNGTMQRLTRKLQLLDTVDEQSGSGKLDIIIQLPYVIKTEALKKKAEQRREDIEFQLKDSRYGIAYTDGTEKITQLNRPAENNLFRQVEYLIGLLYGQLGLTEEIMNGTADEKTMLNYFARTIKPLLDAHAEAMQRAFITAESGTPKSERIKYFRDPFALVPLSNLADIVDKFLRNEVFSANDIRGFMGVKPSKDPKANELRNSNMPEPTEPKEQTASKEVTSTLERTSQNDSDSSQGTPDDR